MALTGCYLCNAMGCGNELSVRLEQAALAFDATKTPTVLVCAGKLCTTFHLDVTSPSQPHCDAAEGALGDFEFCAIQGTAVDFTALGTPDDEIDVSIEVRTPDGTVIFSDHRTVPTEDHSDCGEECYTAKTSFSMTKP